MLGFLRKKGIAFRVSWNLRVTAFGIWCSALGGLPTWGRSLVKRILMALQRALLKICFPLFCKNVKKTRIHLRMLENPKKTQKPLEPQNHLRMLENPSWNVLLKRQTCLLGSPFQKCHERGGVFLSSPESSDPRGEGFLGGKASSKTRSLKT